MQTLESIQQRVQLAFTELKFTGTPHELYDPVRYALNQGGKRLRPFLVLASCALFEGDIEEAIHPAIAIELFHNFTLLHDDLMDQAPLRRGKPTVYRKWNSNIAILAGDTLFALSNKEMLRTRKEVLPELIELFNQTAVEVCEGQQFDMNFETRNTVSIDEYIEMIRLKTAVLLACSLKTGAIIAGAPASDASGIYDFGINIGIAFQLMDDLLDVYGSEAKFGKMTGGDILVAKKTFLYLKAFELSGNKRTELEKVYNSHGMPATQKIRAVRSHFDKLEIEKATRKEIEYYWEKAVSILKALNLPETGRSVMLSYCAELMQREY